MIDKGVRVDQRGMDVLVVDDEPMVRDFIGRVLTRNGYGTRTAGDAGEALAAMTDQAPTLVISDIRMPGKDGTWLLEESKKRWPEMPVIMLTAVSDAKQAVDCLKAGAHDYLVKPIDIDELLIAVMRGAERTQLLRQVQLQRKELEETVRDRTARLRGALETIETTHHETREALVDTTPGAAGLPWTGPAGHADEAGPGPSFHGEPSVELSALRTAGKLIAEGATHLEVAGAIGRELVEKGQLLYARLWVKQRNEHGLEAAVNVGSTAGDGPSLARQVFSTGTTKWEERDSVTSVASPVIVRGVCECALQLGWQEEKQDDMLALCERLSLPLAASVAREHEARERDRAAEELQLFQKLASASRYSLDLEHVARFLMKSLHRIVDYDVAGLLLLEDEPSLTIRARFPMDPEFIDRVRSQIANTLKLTCAVDAPPDLDVRYVDAEGDQPMREPPHKLRAFVNVPLSIGGSVVGLIHVSSGKDQAFSDAEILSVHRAADLLASSLQGVREVLATVKRRVEQMVDHLSDGVLMLDRRGRVVAMNGAARRVLGCAGDLASLDVATLARLFEGDPVSLMRRELRSLRKLVCVRGIPYQTQLSPVIDDGELVGAVLAFQDFEQEKRVDEMKTELVNVVSHEFRTPLTAAKNALSLLQGPKLGSLSTEQERFVEVAKRNVDQLSAIIDDLLDLSKIEAGKMHLDLEAISISEPVASALATFAPEADAKGVGLGSSITPDVPPIFGHAPSLQRVLANLIGNALKFTERGGEVSVEVVPVEGTESESGSASGGIRVTVADSGVGIPPEHLDSIFDKFPQVDSRGRATPGTGLGLSICRELIRAHYGRIWAESDSGKGSRFSFAIPSLSPRDLLLRAIASETERAHEQEGVVSVVLARLANAEVIRESCGEDGLASVMREFLGATRRVVRRSSDRVLWQESAHEVAVILPHTATDGGRGFANRLLEGISKTSLTEKGVLLSVSAVEYPRDGRTAEELYERACEGVREPTVA